MGRRKTILNFYSKKLFIGENLKFSKDSLFESFLFSELFLPQSQIYG
jgi:hypothetical protein